MLFTNCTSCVQDIGDKQEVSKSNNNNNNNNNNNKMTEITTTTKKMNEEEEEYGGVKVLRECKFEVGNQLLNLRGILWNYESTGQSRQCPTYTGPAGSTLPIYQTKRWQNDEKMKTNEEEESSVVRCESTTEFKFKVGNLLIFL